jgi:hypothetical protein
MYTSLNHSAAVQDAEDQPGQQPAVISSRVWSSQRASSPRRPLKTLILDDLSVWMMALPGVIECMAHQLRTTTRSPAGPL